MATYAPVQRREVNLDLDVIAPMRGHVYHLRGYGHAGRSMRRYAEAWTVAALMQGECVHWIDGASRMNPTRSLNRFPVRDSSAREHLHRLYVGRGFTVHQLATLVERLGREVSITAAPLVVIDAPIAMHLDRQVSDHEARCLMRQIIEELHSVAQRNNTAVLVITRHEPESKRHQQLLRMVERQATHELLEHVHGRGRNIRRWLSHQPSGAIGQWPQHGMNLNQYTGLNAKSDQRTDHLIE